MKNPESEPIVSYETQKRLYGFMALTILGASCYAFATFSPDEDDQADFIIYTAGLLMTVYSGLMAVDAYGHEISKGNKDNPSDLTSIKPAGITSLVGFAGIALAVVYLGLEVSNYEQLDKHDRYTWLGGLIGSGLVGVFLLWEARPALKGFCSFFKDGWFSPISFLDRGSDRGRLSSATMPTITNAK